MFSLQDCHIVKQIIQRVIYKGFNCKYNNNNDNLYLKHVNYKL